MPSPSPSPSHDRHNQDQSQHPLSTLCTVCNKSPPRYRCPGCSARTCSLPCYKLHQQRAVCDGKRDPTRYLKKSQLETPAAVDHDFNFLAGIERDLDDAERGLDGRGVGTRDAKRPHLKNFQSFRARLDDTQVTVLRAPVGLSRQKANRTRWNQRTKGILWTVEWIHADQSRNLRDAHDTKTLRDAYAELFPSRRVLKRKRGHDGVAAEPQPKPQAAWATAAVDRPQGSGDDLDPECKRAPAGEPAAADLAAAGQSSGPAASALTPAENQTASSFDSRVGDLSQSQTPPHHPPHGPAAAVALVQPSLSSPSPSPSSTPGLTRQPPQQQPGPSGDVKARPRSPTPPPGPGSGSGPGPGPGTNPETDPWSFYLLKPNTYGKQQALVPLTPDTTLLQALRQRVVLEFPTLVVLPRGALPEGYVTEAAYESMLATERERVDGLLVEEGLDSVVFDEGTDGGGAAGPATAGPSTGDGSTVAVAAGNTTIVGARGRDAPPSGAAPDDAVTGARLAEVLERDFGT